MSGETTSNSQAIRQAGQTYNNSVDLRQATQSTLHDQVANQLMGRLITSQGQFIPQTAPPREPEEGVEAETRLVTIHGSQLNKNGEVKTYRRPKSLSFQSLQRQSEIYYPDDKTFVKTLACDRSYQMLLENHMVTIIGRNGEGKSTIGMWLLGKVAEDLDLDAVRINSPKDWYQVMDFDKEKGEKIAVLIDDIFGCVTINDHTLDEWRSRHETIWNYVKKRQVYLILVVRKNHFIEGSSHFPLNDLFNEKFVLDQTLEVFNLTLSEKKEILRKYLRYRGLAEDVADNLPKDCADIGFPMLVKQYCTVEKFRKWGLRFFTNPVLWYFRDLECLCATEPKIWSVLVLILEGGNQVRPGDFYESTEETSERSTARKLLKSKLLKEGHPAYTIRTICEKINGVYVRFDTKADVYRFIDKHTETAVMLVYGRYNHQEVARICTLDFFCEYLVTYNYELEPPEKNIYMVYTPSIFDYLCERFLKEFLEGNVEILIPHRAFVDTHFIETFFKYLKDKKKLVEVLKTKDKKCGKGMLYLVTMYGHEDLLREIGNTKVFSKTGSSWAKKEVHDAIDLAKEHKLSTMVDMLKNL